MGTNLMTVRVYFKIATLMVILLLLYSCAFHQTYPENWGKILYSSDAECPIISGIYKDLGKEPSNGAFNPSLSRLLLPKMCNYELITHVEIRQSKNIIEIFAWGDNKLLGNQSYFQVKGEFGCEAGMIKFSRSAEIVSGEQVIVASEWGDSFFAKDINGFLVMKTTSSGFGLVIIFPVAVNSSMWYRFEPIIE